MDEALTMNHKEIKAILKERDRLLRDAYYGRNGLSMNENQRKDYKAMTERARMARKMVPR